MLNNSQLDGSLPFGETCPWAQVVTRHVEHVQWSSGLGDVWHDAVGRDFADDRFVRLDPEHPYQLQRTFQSWPAEMQQALKDAYEDGCEIVGTTLSVIHDPSWSDTFIYLPGDKYEPKEEALPPCPFCGDEAIELKNGLIGCDYCELRLHKETWCRRAGKEN